MSLRDKCRGLGALSMLAMVAACGTAVDSPPDDTGVAGVEGLDEPEEAERPAEEVYVKIAAMGAITRSCGCGV